MDEQDYNGTDDEDYQRNLEFESYGQDSVEYQLENSPKVVITQVDMN